MLSLSDDQLAIVRNAAEPLHPEDRSAYLQMVASLLREHAVLGDGIVSRCAREAQAIYLRPPTDTGHAPALLRTDKLARRAAGG